jgi:flagellar biosynthesis protein FlhA
MLLCINVVAGLGLGVLKFGMPVGEALKLYTLLTIGDGIAAAVPALLVSVAGGIIATRAAAESQLGSEVAQQVLRVRQPLAVAAVLLGGLAIVPGMPKLPFVLLAATCGAVAWKMGKPAESTEVEEAPPAPPADPGFADLVRVDPISVELGMSLLSIADEAQGGDLLARIKTVRKQVAQELGLPVPAVRVRDRVDLPGQAYRIKMMDADVARGTLLPHSLLAILPGSEEGVPDGVPTRDPTFGLPARWIRASDREAALSSGCTVVEPSVAVATHLGHVLRREAWRLLGRRETREVLAAVQPSGGEEIVPKLLSLGTVQQVLRNLLKEGVSLRHASVIVDALALAAESTKDVEELTSHARVALGPALCAEKLDADGKLRVFALGTQLEERLRVAAREGGADSALMLDVVEALRRAFAAAPAEPEMVVLCSPSVRGGLRRIVEKVLPSAAVLSHAEIPDTVPLVRLGIAQ